MRSEARGVMREEFANGTARRSSGITDHASRITHHGSRITLRTLILPGLTRYSGALYTGVANF